jgi:hypothetical protein
MRFIDCDLKYSDSKRIKEALLKQAESDTIFKEKLEKWEVEEMQMIKLLATEAYNQEEKFEVGKAKCPLNFGIDEQIAFIIHCVDEQITNLEIKDKRVKKVKVTDGNSNSDSEEENEEENEEETKPVIENRVSSKKKKNKDNNAEQLSLF